MSDNQSTRSVDWQSGFWCMSCYALIGWVLVLFIWHSHQVKSDKMTLLTHRLAEWEMVHGNLPPEIHNMYWLGGD
jgi:hypothetical protein